MEIVHYQGQGDNEKRLIVFLHGFPSTRSKQNREIAEGVVASTGRPADLLLYSGLGCATGQFTFSGCLNDVGDYFERIFSGSVKHIDLVGHSWGGFLSLLMASRYGDRVRKMVLLSPLLHFADEERVFYGFSEIQKENLQLALGDMRALVRDFCDIGKRHVTDQLLAQLSPHTETLFLQAQVDQLTPAEIAIQKKALFPRPPSFELVANDHSFLSDRPELAQRIGRFLGP